VLRLVALAGVSLTLAVTGGASSATNGEPFFVGFSEDLPKEIGSSAVAPAAVLGGSAFRLTTLWSPGRAAPTAAERAKLDRAAAAAAGQRLVLAVFADVASNAPQDAAGREAYCTYVRSILGSYPSIRDVVVWNEPNKALFWSPQATAAARYEELLARCYDVLHAAFPGVNVIGLALSSTGNDNAGSTSPGAFIRAVGDAFRASGRARPVLDTVGHHPYGMEAAERPWRQHIAAKTIAQGDWNKLMYNLFLAFEGTGQPIPGEQSVRIWYTESGSQTSVDPDKQAAYSGVENIATIPDDAGGEPETPAPAETTAAPDQRTQALDAIRLAACQPYVAAYFNFLLADEPRLSGWQSGAYWADLSPKGSVPAFKQAIGQATSGSVDCGSLKGGRPSADFMPPSIPADLHGAGATGPLRVELAWTAATDDESGLSYRIFRDGAHVGTTAETSWTNAAVAPNSSYTYAVRALDAAGNLGSASEPVTVTTGEEPAPPPPPPAATPPVTEPEPAPAASSSPAPEPSIVAGTPPALSPVPSVPPANLPPTAPGRLRAALAGGVVRLTWLKSRDADGVRGYLVFRDGTLRRSLRTLRFQERAPRGRHIYTVRAIDGSGLRGPAARILVRR
jgi:hypothetical protein